MATYEYRCDLDGLIEEIRPLGTAPGTITCATCGGEARRVFSAPTLVRTNREIVAALDHAEKSRDEPEVVTSIPRAGARKPTPMAKMTPALQRLPRP
ncbi:MAG: zinc ribbon domain-containing protein [Chloroflexota bacterium]|nr:zinc ribbon domain-containing protein [Chloroflexota bacterium]